jgi:predicted nuclease of predicted toxin-antitoxin system
MKLLLDENLPRRLKVDLHPHEALTVRDMGWSGKSNGALLALMMSNAFDALITFDKNLAYQQNFRTYSLPVIVLDAEDNTYLSLSPLMPRVIKMLSSELPPGPHSVT